MYELTEKHVTFEASRSGGPGGQNVDKRSTAVRARVNIAEIPLSDREKEFVREHIPPKNCGKEGEIFVENADHRSQHQNKKQALKLLNEEVKKAIEKGRQQQQEKKRKKRIRQKKRGGSGGGSDNRKEKQRKRLRSETMEDLIKQAYEENPELMEQSLGNPDS